MNRWRTSLDATTFKSAYCYISWTRNWRCLSELYQILWNHDTLKNHDSEQYNKLLSQQLCGFKNSLNNLVHVAPAEWLFFKLMLIEYCLPSTIFQGRLSSLAILSTESYIASKFDFLTSLIKSVYLLLKAVEQFCKGGRIPFILYTYGTVLKK